MPANVFHDLRPLSLSARIAIALHLFRAYCSRRGLNHPEIDRFLEHLWDFLALPVGGGGFELWRRREPPLTHVGLGDDFPPDFDPVLKVAGVSATEFRHALACTTEVLYSSMYGAADEKGSWNFLSQLANVAESVGAKWPDINCFADSNWSDGHGWGQRLSAQELVDWRNAGHG
jgi:hypothetical protein